MSNETTRLMYKRTKYGDHPHYLVFPFDEGVHIRPLSSNDPSNPVKPGDSHLFYHGFVKDLNSFSKAPIYYGFKPWQEHILGKMMSVITKGEVNKYGIIEYEHKGHRLLKHVLTNGEFHPDGSGWSGQTTVLMNVIDRTDDFCIRRNQSKVLTTRVKYKEGNFYSSLGFPIKIFDDMMKKANKSLLDTDYFIYRNGWGSSSSTHREPFEVYSFKDDCESLEDLDLLSCVSSTYSLNALTEEEKNYNLYDFSTMPLYQPSVAGYIYYVLKNFIKEADKEFPGHGFEEYYRTLMSEDEKVKKEIKFSQERIKMEEWMSSQGKRLNGYEWCTLVD